MVVRYCQIIITHKGIIKNPRLIPISDLNDNELCIFGIMDFPNLDGKYPNTIVKGTLKQIGPLFIVERAV